MTLTQFPESKFWDFCWNFCPEMTLAQFPEFGFFVQNSRIGVKWLRLHFFEYESSNTFTTLFLHLVETVLWLSFFFHPNSVQGEEICTLSYFSCISSHYFHSKDEFSWRFYENKLLSWISYSVKSFVSNCFWDFRILCG